MPLFEHRHGSLVAHVVVSPLEVALRQIPLHLPDEIIIFQAAIAVQDAQAIEAEQHLGHDVALIEIARDQLTAAEFVHGGAGIADRRHLVGVDLLPQVPGSLKHTIYRDLPEELPVLAATVHELLHQLQISRADAGPFTGDNPEIEPRTLVGVHLVWRDSHDRVRFVPRLHRIPHATDGCPETMHFGLTYANHCLLLVSISAHFPHQGIPAGDVTQTAIVNRNLQHMPGIPIDQPVPVVI